MRSHSSPLFVHLATFTLFLFLIAGGALAQSADPDLSGLRGVDLGVQLQHDTETHLGLTGQDVYKVVAEELRKGRVSFLPWPKQDMTVSDRFQKMPADYAMLYFEIVTVVGAGMRENFALDVRLNLLDRVRLSRDGSKETVASIYKRQHLVLMSGRGGAREVLERVRAMAKGFAADFRAANPETNKR